MPLQRALLSVRWGWWVPRCISSTARLAMCATHSVTPANSWLHACSKSSSTGQEIAFDQPHHGFDSLFTAPDLPLIVVESKVNRQGQFRPGQTRAGEQGIGDLDCRPGRQDGRSDFRPVESHQRPHCRTHPGARAQRTSRSLPWSLQPKPGKPISITESPGGNTWAVLCENVALDTMLKRDHAADEETST